MKFRIIDTQDNHKPIKSGFLKASRAHNWCKENLPKGTWTHIGELSKSSKPARYIVIGYKA